MKHLILLPFLLIFASLLAVGGPPPPENQYVKFRASVRQPHLRAGAKGLLLIKLEPQAGIHINLEPPMTLKLADSTTITLGPAMEFSTIKKDTLRFLDASKPIRQSFIVLKRAKPGAATLSATLTYFYCSDADGWCSRFKQPVDVKVQVVK
jgi:hypothetical protein